MAADQEIAMVSLVRNLQKFFACEPCGRFTSCRHDTPW